MKKFLKDELREIEEIEELQEYGNKLYNRKELKKEFIIESEDPWSYIIVTRKKDKVEGIMDFTEKKSFYYNFKKSKEEL